VLIASTGKTISAILQILKETGMRIREALSLELTDIDFERNAITPNHPEKGSLPRIFKISQTLIGKINQFPKTTDNVFTKQIRQSVSANFRLQRKRIAHKLGNLRLDKITFHTFRYWKATMEYAKTRDILHVMQLLVIRTSETREYTLNWPK
jgi:integrase